MYLYPCTRRVNGKRKLLIENETGMQATGITYHTTHTYTHTHLPSLSLSLSLSLNNVLPTIRTVTPPTKGDGEAMSRHCMLRASNVRSALKVRMEVPQWSPPPMTLEAWRRGPHVPLDKGASLPWHGGVCPSMIMAPGHRGSEKDHLVWEEGPLTSQVHLAIVPGQRGVESKASQEKAWAPAEVTKAAGNISHMLQIVPTTYTACRFFMSESVS